MPIEFKSKSSKKPVASSEASNQIQCPDILTLTRSVSIDPDPIQQQLLTSPSTRVLVNCTRQWGKSTCAAIKALHVMATEPESLVIIASPSERQSAELLLKLKKFAKLLTWKTRTDGVNQHSLVLVNGSRIVALPDSEKRVRGYSAVRLLIVDEAAAVNDTLYQTLRPMLATSNGTIWLLSTARDKDGFFWNHWSGPAGLGEQTQDEWLRLKVQAKDCPRIPAEFLAEEQQSKTEREYGWEYQGKFGETEERTFKEEWIQRLWDPTVPPMFHIPELDKYR